MCATYSRTSKASPRGLLLFKAGEWAHGPSRAGLSALSASLGRWCRPTRRSISKHLGARYDETSSKIVFRIYSSRATRIELHLYADANELPAAATYVLTRDAANVWSVTVSVADLRAAGIDGPVFYGYRAWGPNWPYVANWTAGSPAGFVADVDASGNRFNPNKLLLDPYALEVSHDPINPRNNDRTVFASGESYRALDSGPKAPKGIVLMVDRSSTGTKPTRAQKDDVIYEVHVRGLTENDPTFPRTRAAPIAAPRSRPATCRVLG